MKCRICGHGLREAFLSLGKTPLANNFVRKEDLHKAENYYPLDVHHCAHCHLVQLGFSAPAHEMFSHYVYVSSTTKTFRDHFSSMAKELCKELSLGEGSLAIDIGSNDGLLLKGFMAQGVRAIGVEPAQNLADLANKEGVETLCEFFSDETVKKIIEKAGHADVVTANNVFAHTDTIHDIARGVFSLLKDDGVFVIECAYLLDMLEKMTFDSIYHEHVCYYSLHPLVAFFTMHGMEIFHVQHVNTHGGSLRVMVKKTASKRAIKGSVSEMLAHEKKSGVCEEKTYTAFAQRVEDSKKELLSLLQSLHAQGKSIAGYGAPAKATTLLHYLGLGSNDLRYIIEDNALKQGLYTPGNHIPCRPSSTLDSDPVDYVLILAWNFAPEILKKMEGHQQKGMKFIVPFPKPHVAG